VWLAKTPHQPGDEDENGRDDEERRGDISGGEQDDGDLFRSFGSVAKIDDLNRNVRTVTPIASQAAD
jgi:hypothetical protein